MPGMGAGSPAKSITRRDMLKGAVATGALVWTAPVVRAMPAYASPRQGEICLSPCPVDDNAIINLCVPANTCGSGLNKGAYGQEMCNTHCAHNGHCDLGSQNCASQKCVPCLNAAMSKYGVKKCKLVPNDQCPGMKCDAGQVCCSCRVKAKKTEKHDFHILCDCKCEKC